MAGYRVFPPLTERAVFVVVATAVDFANAAALMSAILLVSSVRLRLPKWTGRAFSDQKVIGMVAGPTVLCVNVLKFCCFYRALSLAPEQRFLLLPVSWNWLSATIRRAMGADGYPTATDAVVQLKPEEWPRAPDDD